MIPLQFLLFAAGTALIRLLHAVRRRLVGEDKYFSFSDFLVEEQHVQVRGFVYSTLPAFLGGGVLALFPAVHPVVAVSAGLTAAFLGVWPVFKFPYHLLDEYLLPHWGKLKFLYVLFVGFSGALSYVGFLTAREAIPLVMRVGGTAAWETFLDDLAANAIYDTARTIVVATFMLGGVYVTRERKRIGKAIEDEKHKEWEKEFAEYRRSEEDEGIERATSDPGDSEAVG
ncbi:MAG: hypothetical protein ABIP09_03365 [Gemmatimonadaceae bacterium]